MIRRVRIKSIKKLSQFNSGTDALQPKFLYSPVMEVYFCSVIFKLN